MSKGRKPPHSNTEESSPKRRRTSDFNELEDVSPSCHSLETLEEISWAGRVEKLQMTNFMCHSNLELTFNPRINFVSGRNGSGKSAIMAALVVVLGGTASNTGRAHGVADFIKKGENAGRVSIVLINEGLNPYKPEDYGDRITITRSFAQGSNNSYTIKSAWGAVISKKREEVDRIRDALQLQIKNPICVLNQDVARSFLSSADSKVRFELFMQATQLRLLLDRYTETAENLSQARKDLDKKKHLLDEAKREVDELTKKLKYISSLEKHVAERTKLENEFIWAGVNADENTLKALQSDLAGLQLKVNEINSAIASHQTDELEEEINRRKEEMDAEMLKKVSRSERKRSVYTEIMGIERETVGLEKQISLVTSKLKRTECDLMRVKEYIEQIDESVSRSAAEQARCQEQMRSIERELAEIKDKTVHAQRDMENAEETKMRIKEEVRQIATTVNDLERAKAHKLTQLEGMKGKESIELVRFGSFVPRLLQAIEAADRAKRFVRRPVGPCGLYIKLNCDAQWAPAIESVIGSMMAAFCCDNRDDYRVLYQIFIEVCGTGARHPIVIVSKFQSGRHNLGSNRVRARGLCTVLDSLTVSNDTVFNTLVDQAAVERILLFETDEQASALLGHVENVPKGLQQGVTIKCDRYIPAPNYATYAGIARPPRFFDTTTKREDVVKKLEAEIRNIENDIGEHVSEQQALGKKLENIKDFGMRSEGRLKELRERRIKLESQISQLRDQEQSRPVPRTRVALEEELEILEKQKEECSQELKKKQDTLEAYKVKYTEANTKLEAASREVQEVQSTINRLEGELDRKKEELNVQKLRRKNANSQLKALTSQINTLKEKEAKSIVELEKTIADAEEICDRIETDRAPADIQKLLAKQEQYLKAAEKISGSKEDAIAEFRLKKDRYDTLLVNQQKMDELIRFFISSIKNRRQLYLVKQRLTAQTVAHVFRASLMTRGYDGMVSFNFEEKRLELEVYPHKDGDDIRKDSKTLSGGERSYSTVSFILAIWRTVRMPFYFLDEFDVFMDKVNRKVIMDLLLENAKESSGRQYVFITPQDISSIAPSDVITVYKMPDPERNMINE